MGEYRYRSGRVALDAAAREALLDRGWDLGRDHHIDSSDRVTWRLVYQKERADGSRPPNRILAHWGSRGDGRPLIVHSAGYEEAFGLLLDDMSGLGGGKQHG